MISKATHDAPSTARFAARVLVLCAALLASVLAEASGEKGSLPTPSPRAEVVSMTSEAMASQTAAHAKGMLHGGSSPAERSAPCESPCDPDRCPPECGAIACATLGTSVAVTAGAPRLAPRRLLTRSVRPREASLIVVASSSPPYRPPIV